MDLTASRSLGYSGCQCRPVTGPSVCYHFSSLGPDAWVLWFSLQKPQIGRWDLAQHRLALLSWDTGVQAEMLTSACPGDTVAVLEARTSSSTVRRDNDGRAALWRLMDSGRVSSRASSAVICAINVWNQICYVPSRVFQKRQPVPNPLKNQFLHGTRCGWGCQPKRACPMQKQVLSLLLGHADFAEIPSNCQNRRFPISWAA